MPKCSACGRFKFSPNTCVLCKRKYCNKCECKKYSAVPFNSRKPKFPVTASSSLYKKTNVAYETMLYYHTGICPYCYYSYIGSTNIPSLCEDFSSDSSLADVFIHNVIKNHDVTIIYDEPFNVNNSVFFFLNDMQKLIAHQDKIGKPYPYEIFYYTVLPYTPYEDKKSLPLYRQALSRVSRDVQKIISSYDNISMSSEALQTLAERLIQISDRTGKTQALAGFLTICNKYDISISTFDNYTISINALSVRQHHIDMERRHEIICNNILKEYAYITSYKHKIKKAVIVMPHYNYIF